MFCVDRLERLLKNTIELHHTRKSIKGHQVKPELLWCSFGTYSIFQKSFLFFWIYSLCSMSTFRLAWLSESFVRSLPAARGAASLESFLFTQLTVLPLPLPSGFPCGPNLLHPFSCKLFQSNRFCLFSFGVIRFFWVCFAGNWPRGWRWQWAGW